MREFDQAVVARCLQMISLDLLLPLVTSKTKRFLFLSTRIQNFNLNCHRSELENYLSSQEKINSLEALSPKSQKLFQYLNFRFNISPISILNE